MLDSSQPWRLFGYDLRGIVYYVRAGWSEFLWGSRSPVFPAIDEPVLVHLEDGGHQYLQAGRVVPAPATDESLAEAALLPDRLVLSRTIRLPRAVEAELEAAVALEVKASSPFPESDTCYGYQIVGRTETDIEVQLVIGSFGAVMAYIAEKFDSHEREAYEVWARAGEHLIMLRGFGEAGRGRRNRKRLGRMLGLLGYCLLVPVLLSMIAAGAKYLELQQVVETQARVQRAAAEAVSLREDLAEIRSLIDTAKQFMVEYPSVHRELSRLASILGDDTWISSADLRGTSLRIEGQAANASAVMQQLLDHPAYAQVEAPAAFQKVRSGLERFVLDLTLAPGAQVQ